MTLIQADSLCAVRGQGHWRAHATCIAHGDDGLLILGKSGAGKSTLAAEMIALGCALVCDDAVEIKLNSGENLICMPPENAPEQLEMRGFGLLPIPLKRSAKLTCCIVLGENAAPRFPPEEAVIFDECEVPIYRASYDTGLAAKAVLLLRHGGRTLRG